MIFHIMQQQKKTCVEYGQYLVMSIQTLPNRSLRVWRSLIADQTSSNFRIWIWKRTQWLDFIGLRWWILTTNPCSHFKHCNILTICCVIMEKYTTINRWVGYCCTTTVNTLLCIRKWSNSMNAAYMYPLCVYIDVPQWYIYSQKFTIKLPLYYRDYLRVFS